MAVLAAEISLASAGSGELAREHALKLQLVEALAKEALGTVRGPERSSGQSWSMALTSGVSDLLQLKA